jgi:hypothetical protein
LEVQLAAAAQLAQEQQQPPPEQEAPLIRHHQLQARVGQRRAPTVKAGPEMADGPDQGASQA